MIDAKGYTGKIPVYCAFDKIEDIGNIKPNPKNPNKHPEEQIELLAKIIEAQGWRAPVTVSTLSGLVVRGHGRLMAAQHLRLESVPVDYQNYNSPDEELADLVADNRISELAEIDKAMLSDIFSDINFDMIDADVFGYSADEIDAINEALAEDIEMKIDDISSKSEVCTHTLRLDKKVIQITDDEFERLSDLLDTYIENNGVMFGFVRWLLDD